MYAVYKEVEIPETKEKVGTGWLPPYPDFRDYTEEEPKVQEIFKNLGFSLTKREYSLPEKVNLSYWCSPIENQGQLGSCTAQAAAGIIEYFQNRKFGKYIDSSRLFIYKTTRNLLGLVGDTGAWIRNTIGALAFCGVPPERYWPYTDRKQPGVAEERTFDEEPPSFVYAIAENYEALKYFCHDPATKNIHPNEVLKSVKRYLAAGIPSMFGFYGFPSFNSSNIPGGMPFPCSDEEAIWGHAVVAVGYDDSIKIENTKCKKETIGALLIANSWGASWGSDGYGWLPYDYVINRIAIDFWSLLNMEWLDPGIFGFPQE